MMIALITVRRQRRRERRIGPKLHSLLQICVPQVTLQALEPAPYRLHLAIASGPVAVTGLQAESFSSSVGRSHPLVLSCRTLPLSDGVGPARITKYNNRRLTIPQAGGALSRAHNM